MEKSLSYEQYYEKLHGHDGLKTAMNSVYGITGRESCKNPFYFGIKKVIYNYPATIVIWADGTKTVVKVHNEDFDPEKGLAMAICKKAFGNGYDFHRVFKKWASYPAVYIGKPTQKELGEKVFDYCANDVAITKEVIDEMSRQDIFYKEE